jgi:hypothetical protein
VKDQGAMLIGGMRAEGGVLAELDGHLETF